MEGAVATPEVDFRFESLELTDKQLQEFQEVVDWKTGMELPDGRILGIAGKRGKIARPLDFRIARLAADCHTADKCVLEFGCLEGIHTVQLAGVCREVIALDVRPRNIVCTMIRCFVHKAGNVRPLLCDARDVHEKLDRLGWGVDAIFHVGVLYHLMDPVEHLMQLSRMTDTILLDTHYCLEDTKPDRHDIEYRGRVYEAYYYNEKGWADPFSGVQPQSRWLHRSALMQVLEDAGFTSIDVIDDRIERNGPRISILARR